MEGIDEGKENFAPNFVCGAFLHIYMYYTPGVSYNGAAREGTRLSHFCIDTTVVFAFLHHIAIYCA
jgi:hypothetical protein